MAETEASQDRCVRFQIGYSCDLSCITRFMGGIKLFQQRTTETLQWNQN